MYERSNGEPRKRGTRTGRQGRIGPEGLTCGADPFGSHVSSSKVFLYRMGHGIGGMARHTCRAPRPTAAVTQGLSRVPPWQMSIGHFGPGESLYCLRVGLGPNFPVRENSVYCSRPAALAQAGTGRGICLLVLVTDPIGEES